MHYSTESLTMHACIQTAQNVKNPLRSLTSQHCPDGCGKRPPFTGMPQFKMNPASFANPVTETVTESQMHYNEIV